MLDSTITGKIIKNARSKIGLTQEQLAEKLFVSKQAVSNWERGINLPDESVRNKLEELLDIKLRNDTVTNRRNTSLVKEGLYLKPFAEITDMEEVFNAISSLVDTIVLSEYSSVVKRMIRLTLATVLGFEIYYQDHCRHFYSEEPLDWDCTAEDLQRLIDDSDDWLIDRVKLSFGVNGMIARKAKTMSFLIGGELFEDFDDEGYRDGFVQQIGKYADKTGEDLANLLPDSNTDIMLVYKNAIYDLIDVLS